MVAFVPSVMFNPEGREMPSMQKFPRPVSLKVGRRMVLKAEPTSLPKPIRTSMLVERWLLRDFVSLQLFIVLECLICGKMRTYPMLRAIEPSFRGHGVRLVDTVS